MSDNQNFNNNVLIEVKDLHKAFGDHEVLKGINTTISKGEVVVNLQYEANLQLDQTRNTM